MNTNTMHNQRGFTLIEMLMVIILVGILAAVAFPQFLDFKTEARNAATNSALGTLRTAILEQTGQGELRCNAAAGLFPQSAAVIANDVTDASDNNPNFCVTAWVNISAAEKHFIPNAYPANPWTSSGATPSDGTIAANAITPCAGTGCNPVANPTKDCTGAAAYAAATVGGWCYNQLTGQIWANSANNGQAVTENLY